MSVMRSSGLLMGLVLLLGVVAACGAATTTASGSLGAVATPPPASQPVQASTDPGTGTVSNPPIVVGAYTSGKFHVEISGDVTATIDASLQGGVSFTTAESTILSFADAASGAGGGVILSAEVNGITISSPAVTTGGSNVDASHCNVAVTQSDASRVAGTFDCQGILGVVSSGTDAKTVTVNVRGTFEASR